ncbi:MAG: hypothetical protein ACE14P_09950 [Methanotrichaceae archaeon]
MIRGKESRRKNEADLPCKGQKPTQHLDQKRADAGHARDLTKVYNRSVQESP